jgi:hypothetical protein
MAGLDVALALNAVTAVSVVVGVVFAILQLRHPERKRAEQAALAFVAQWEPEHLAAVRRVYELPDAAPPEQVDGEPGARRAAEIVWRARSQTPGEWFQWLAERLAEQPARDESVGAFTAHRDWRP